MTPTISADQHNQFEELGYTILEHVFTVEEMEALSARIDVFHQKEKQRLLDEHEGAAGISRASEIIFNAYLAESDPEIAKFCLREEFVHISNELLGADVDLYWNQSVFKEPEGEKEFSLSITSKCM